MQVMNSTPDLDDDNWYRFEKDTSLDDEEDEDGDGIVDIDSFDDEDDV